MVTIAVLMSLMINLSSGSVKATLDIYLKEQAELLARGATEYAILAVSGHDNNVSCIENINIAYPEGADNTHDINMTIMYMGRGIRVATCNNILSNL